METIFQNLWDTTKAILKGKFIVMQAYPGKQEKSQLNKLTSQLKKLKREEQTKPKVSRMKKIIKIRMEINEIETKKQQKRSVKPRAGSLTRKRQVLSL